MISPRLPPISSGSAERSVPTTLCLCVLCGSMLLLKQQLLNNRATEEIESRAFAAVDPPEPNSVGGKQARWFRPACPQISSGSCDRDASRQSRSRCLPDSVSPTTTAGCSNAEEQQPTRNRSPTALAPDALLNPSAFSHARERQRASQLNPAVRRSKRFRAVSSRMIDKPPIASPSARVARSSTPSRSASKA